VLLVLASPASAKERPRVAAENIASLPGSFDTGDRSNMSPQRGFVPGEVLVRYRSGVTESERTAVARAEGAQARQKLPVRGVERVKVQRGESVAAEVRAFEDRPEVAYAQPNYLRKAMAVPNDPRFAQQWGLHNTGQSVGGTVGSVDADIDAPEAWSLTKGSERVTVAVVDTGVSYTHGDLAANVWRNPGEVADNGVDDDSNGYVDDVRGWDFSHLEDPRTGLARAKSNDPSDAHGHGSHVAGTIGASGNNAAGVTGVNWRTKIMPVKVLNDSGVGSDAAIAAGFTYAARNGAKIVNASLGGPGSSPVLEDAVAQSPDTLFVVAAGNGDEDGLADDNDVTPVAPCNIDSPNVVCVAATDGRDALTGFSNYGAESVDLAAPGMSILSTHPRQDVFSDNFEQPLTGRWTTGGINNSWARTTEAAASGAHSLTDSPGALYRSNTNSWARTGALATSGQNCTLEVLASLWTEAKYDYLAVEASRDGATWTELGAYTGWGQGVISEDLSAFDGRSSTYLRFRLVSDSIINDDGVYLDDVEVSCRGAGYRPSSGTSMASPHVAGVAALVADRVPTASVADLRAALLDGVDRKASLEGKVATGGRLNALKALLKAQPDNVAPPAPTIASPPQNSYDTDGAVTVQGSAEADTTIRVYEGATLKGSTTAGSTGAWSVNVTGLADGGHTFTAKSTDVAGNTSEPSLGRSVVVDKTKPTVKSVGPPRGATGIPVTANVFATFSERMNPSTVTKGTVKLVRKGTTTPVAASVTYDAALSRAKLDPSFALRRGATYVATVTIGVRDLAGNPMTASKTWSFTVRR
jgi:subtilisin family serine protease